MPSKLACRPVAESPQTLPAPQESSPWAKGELLPLGVASAQGRMTRPSPWPAIESYFIRTSSTKSPLPPKAPSCVQRYGKASVLAPPLSLIWSFAKLTFPGGPAWLRPAQGWVARFRHSVTSRHQRSVLLTIQVSSPPPAVTGSHSENSEVLPVGSVAVAVTTSPVVVGAASVVE